MQMGCFCSHSQHPTDESKEQKEKNRIINIQIAKDKHEYKSTHRLLLLGEFFSAIEIQKCLFSINAQISNSTIEHF